MDLEKVLEQLRSELHNLDAAIMSLERLHLRGRRRGRPPSWMAGDRKSGASKRSSKPRGSSGGKKAD